MVLPTTSAFGEKASLENFDLSEASSSCCSATLLAAHALIEQLGSPVADDWTRQGNIELQASLALGFSRLNGISFYVITRAESLAKSKQGNRNPTSKDIGIDFEALSER